MQQWRDRAGWSFLFIVGVILMVIGAQGRFGSLLAVFLAPDQMQVTPDTSGGGTADSGEQPAPDNGAGTTSGGGSSTRR